MSLGRVLVVEDESAIAEMLEIVLKHAGYEVTVAHTAEEARAVVDRELPTIRSEEHHV